MKDDQTFTPSVSDVMHFVATVSADTLVRDVMGLFQNDQSLLALPVADNDRFAGIIHRKALFFEHLGRPFAVDLYARKPIRVLLPDAGFTIGPDLDIHSALAELLKTDPGLATDSFPVVSNGVCHGIVAVSDLMMKISQSQSVLLGTLERLSARITEEVAKARIIQQELLPPPESRIGRLQISAEVVTSSEIGGDFYDYFPITEQRIGLVVADVSGHGVQAGMVTTAAKASLHTLIAQGVTTPAALLSGMNNAILATACQNLLMTCLIAIIDCEDGRLTIANAGHNFPYLRRNASASAERIEEVANFPLGFERDCVYREWSTRFAPGDTLLLYTDGIIECVDAASEEFGYQRFEKIFADAGGSSPGELRQRLKLAAERHNGSGSFEDDVTLLVATLYNNS